MGLDPYSSAPWSVSTNLLGTGQNFVWCKASFKIRNVLFLLLELAAYNFRT